jgi:hypothetical protein
MDPPNMPLHARVADPPQLQTCVAKIEEHKTKTICGLFEKMRAVLRRNAMSSATRFNQSGTRRLVIPHKSAQSLCSRRNISSPESLCAAQVKSSSSRASISPIGQTPDALIGMNPENGQQTIAAKVSTYLSSREVSR